MHCRLHYRNVSAAKRCSFTGLARMRCFGWMLLLTGLCGCGLAEYEDKLKEERLRVKLAEDERRQLNPPLDMPGQQPMDLVPPVLAEINVFLRPPKLFGCRPTPVGIVGLGSFTALYGYSGQEGRNILLAGSNADNVDAAKFQEDVWRAFVSFLKVRGVAEKELPTEPRLKKQEEKLPPRTGKEVPQPLKLDLWIWDEPEMLPPAKGDTKATTTQKNKEREGSRYWIYLYRPSGAQVAVIYQLPLSRATDAALLRGMDASIKSLAVGADAVARRAALQKEK
jgi:hypothetical protein